MFTHPQWRKARTDKHLRLDRGGMPVDSTLHEAIYGGSKSRLREPKSMFMMVGGMHLQGKHPCLDGVGVPAIAAPHGAIPKFALR